MSRIQILMLVLAAVGMVFINGCGKQADEGPSEEEIQKMEQEYSTFSKELQDKLAKAYTDYALAEWEAANTGKGEDFDKAAKLETIINNMLADKSDYKKLKKYKKSGLIKDEILQRELHMLYNEYLGNQFDKNKLKIMTELSSEISKKFQNFRATVGDKEYTDNDVEKMLKTSKNSDELKAIWEAHKDMGPVVADDIINLVKMRNEKAKALGFENYHEMSLKLSDQEPEDVSRLFDELDELTRDSFKALKDDIDEVIAKQCNISKEELMPWHYQNRYFQEAPAIYDIDLDTYYEGKDIVKLTEDYFLSIGMPIDELIAASDLFEREGKNQHAFCIDIDRKKKDVRVLCNVKDNYNWMNTMLHEYGHAVYFKWQDESLPWVLDYPAHIFTTEAIAMLFGRMAANPKWMKDMLGIEDAEIEKISETAHKIQKLEQLVFSRWSQVMYRFEKSLYADPDQDLNKLWWDLVEKYQMVKRPEGRDMPDWATKTHIASSPCYYHNYHLGELLASQLYHHINTKLLKGEALDDNSFKDNKVVGDYLIANVFKPSARYYWNNMIEKATGEKLTAKYYANQFVK